MKVALVQFNFWDKLYRFVPGETAVKPGDLVVVKMDFGLELGKVTEVRDLKAEEKKDDDETLELERLASQDDAAQMAQNNQESKKEEALSYCRKIVKRHGLEMKLADCQFSFDDRRLTFAFIADGRVDFRNAVKELSRHFQRSIRLHQLGVRDEAMVAGDVGSCGRGLCCRGHLEKLGNVSSDFAEHQQILHRGSERLSGVCGRLKCCLAYENDLYEELAKKLPAIGARVKTKHGRGEVIGWHTLRGSVDVKIDPEKAGERSLIVEVPIK